MEDIELLARKYFSFLENDFSFNAPVAGTTSSSHTIKYENDLLIVEIEDAYRDQYLNIKIFNKALPLSKSSYKHISLFHILVTESPGFDYSKGYISIMPKRIGTEPSFERVSQLFKEYAADFLTGKKWYSWDEISGLTYPEEDSTIINRVKQKHQPTRF
jgi:hypothetical protein